VSEIKLGDVLAYIYTLSDSTRSISSSAQRHRMNNPTTTARPLLVLH